MRRDGVDGSEGEWRVYRCLSGKVVVVVVTIVVTTILAVKMGLEEEVVFARDGDVMSRDSDGSRDDPQTLLPIYILNCRIACSPTCALKAIGRIERAGRMRVLPTVDSE